MNPTTNSAHDSPGDCTSGPEMIRQPKKRRRYTRIACEFCKTKKVKCSGNMPCMRCTENNAHCHYHNYLPQPAPRQIPRRINREAGRVSDVSQQELRQVLVSMKRICDGIQSSSTQPASIPPRGFSLKRRWSNHRDLMLQNASRSPSDSISPTGMARAVLGPREGVPPSHHDLPPPSALREITQPEDIPVVDLQAASEVLDFGYERVLQLFETFTQEVYVIYPCISLDFAIDRIEAVFGPQSPFTNGESVILGLDLIDLEILKVTLAIGMLIQDDDSHPWSSKLEEHLIWNVDTNMKQEVPHIEDVIMATLMTIYFILQDQAAKAWRISGVAIKACLELGLHKERPNETRDNRLPTYDFLQDLFSCVYDLDKRCSFDMGLPSTLHDKDIDDGVLSMDGRHPFLLTMVKLNRIHSEVVEHHNSISKCGGKETEERAEFLEFQIQKLMESAREIQLFPPESKVLPSPSTQRTMETFITLRTTQIKMLTQVRALSSSQALSGRPQRAYALISRAIFTVETHTKLMSAVGYREIARLFRSMIDRYLMESVSCMLLAASYSPKVYGVMCRNAFHTALDILGQSPHRQRGQNCDVFNSLDDLRRKGETMQMPPLERPFPTVITPNVYPERTQIPQVQQTSTGTDFFPPCEPADLDFFPAPGEMNSSWELPLNSFGFFNDRAALFTL